MEIDFDEPEETTPGDCVGEVCELVNDWITVKTAGGGVGPPVAPASIAKPVVETTVSEAIASPEMPEAEGWAIGSTLFAKCGEPPWTSMMTGYG